MNASKNILGFATALLVALPLAAANHDGDPLPDQAEVVCGFPAVANIVNSLPTVGGRCSGADYVSPIFNPPACPECSSVAFVDVVNVPLTSGADVPGVPLLPVPVPSFGPFQSPPVDQPVGTIQAMSQDGRYCIFVTPNGSPTLFQCFDLRGQDALIPPIGPVTLVHVDPQTVGPSPGVPEGGLGTTPPVPVPALSMDLNIHYQWVDSKIAQHIGPGLVNVYEPVDLLDANAISWWVNNGDRTTVSLTLTLRADGAPLQTVTVEAPYVGQALAAAVRLL
jgi:hypothetical protein